MNMDKLTLKSYSKVNLYLNVINKRKDGYHNINTLFERISLADTITLKDRKDGVIRVACSDPAVPNDASNLCCKSAELLRRVSGVKAGVDIKIRKRIPVGAGLGGGSGNAAAVLLGLNKLWNLRLSKERLAKLGARIGSDVPFFIYGVSFAEGRGRGNIIRPFNEMKGLRLWHILAVPRLHVSTPLIYRKWDDFSGLIPPFLRKSSKRKERAGLTIRPSSVKLLTLALAERGSLLAPGLLFNSLEGVTVRMYPQVRRIKDRLLSLGVKPVLMSGSGPAVFGIVSSRKEALSLSAKLKKHNGSWRVFVAKTA